jgi:NAD(P)-dependent dehydrogenase (short-subunit alcohol dehydrogenase family)
MNTRLEDKVVVVTGGSSGMGRTTALALARAGASVVIADVDVEGGHSAVVAAARAGGQACFLATDVRCSEQIQRALDCVTRHYGRLHGAFNSSGIRKGTFVPLAELDMPTWDRVMAIQLRGLCLCLKHQIPLLLKRGGGAIVNCALMADQCDDKRVAAAHIASMHGALGLTRAAALEYADQNIRVLAFCPGLLDEAALNQQRLVPSGERVARIEQAADAVVRLFSDAPVSITGRALPIDCSLVTP